MPSRVPPVASPHGPLPTEGVGALALSPLPGSPPRSYGARSLRPVKSSRPSRTRGGSALTPVYTGPCPGGGGGGSGRLGEARRAARLQGWWVRAGLRGGCRARGAGRRAAGRGGRQSFVLCVPALPGSGVFLEPPAARRVRVGRGQHVCAGERKPFDIFPRTFQEKRAGPASRAIARWGRGLAPRGQSRRAHRRPTRPRVTRRRVQGAAGEARQSAARSAPLPLALRFAALRPVVWL